MEQSTISYIDSPLVHDRIHNYFIHYLADHFTDTANHFSKKEKGKERERERLIKNETNIDVSITTEQVQSMRKPQTQTLTNMLLQAE